MLASLVVTFALTVSPACASPACALETIRQPAPTDGVLIAHAQRITTRNVFVWTAAMQARWREAQAQQERARVANRPNSTPGPRAPRASAASSGTVNGHPCGGELPPCSVLQRESNGTNAQNSDGRSASGYWQIQDATWGGFMGYARAVDAPGWVQDLRAAQLAPCNWEPPNYCG